MREKHLQAITGAKSVTYVMNVACGELTVTIVEDPDGKPITLFAQLGKAGTCARVNVESVCRLGTKILDRGGDLQELYSAMSGLSCGRPLWNKGRRIESCVDGLAYAVEQYLEKGS